MIHQKIIKKTGGKVGIITAGTSDISVAEEARLMCEAMNCECITSYDIGIAGLHRMFPILKEFIKSEVNIIIVVAGMEGALPTVVHLRELISRLYSQYLRFRFGSFVIYVDRKY